MRCSARPPPPPPLYSKLFVEGWMLSRLQSMRRPALTPPPRRFKRCRLRRVMRRALLLNYSRGSHVAQFADAEKRRAAAEAATAAIRAKFNEQVRARGLLQSVHARRPCLFCRRRRMLHSAASCMRLRLPLKRTFICTLNHSSILPMSHFFFRSAADCTRVVSGALGLMDGYNQRLLFANRSKRACFCSRLLAKTNLFSVRRMATAKSMFKARVTQLRLRAGLMPLRPSAHLQPLTVDM